MIRGRIGSTLSKNLKRISQIIFSAKVYIGAIQCFGGLSILLGNVISMLGFYALAAQEGITFSVGRLSLDPILVRFLFITAGILLTLEGIIVSKIVLKITRLSVISIIFGFCSLNVPAIFLGLGYTLVAGVFAVIFGFLWLITVLAWLQRGE